MQSAAGNLPLRSRPHADLLLTIALAQFMIVGDSPRQVDLTMARLAPVADQHIAHEDVQKHIE